MPQTQLIDVCICTYRRQSLIDTIRSIANQRLPEGLRLRVVISDNDEVPSAEAVVREHCETLGLDYVYVHAPARNISVARNAALDAVIATLVAFIDDDEIATPTWLAALLDCRTTTQATIVFGPVQAVYGGGPQWLADADLHSIGPAFRYSGVIDTGYTCNVLLDYGAMTGDMRTCRFDLALGRSGGEDTFFFHRLYSLGAHYSFSEQALVRESVPSHRGRLRWLMERHFRSGQTHARVLLTRPTWRVHLMVVAGIKLSYCLIVMVASIASPVRWRQMAVRAALHAGVMCRVAGLPDRKIY